MIDIFAFLCYYKSMSNEREPQVQLAFMPDDYQIQMIGASAMIDFSGTYFDDSDEEISDAELELREQAINAKAYATDLYVLAQSSEAFKTATNKVCSILGRPSLGFEDAVQVTGKKLPTLERVYDISEGVLDRFIAVDPNSTMEGIKGHPLYLGSILVGINPEEAQRLLTYCEQTFGDTYLRINKDDLRIENFLRSAGLSLQSPGPDMATEAGWQIEDTLRDSTLMRGLEAALEDSYDMDQVQDSFKLDDDRGQHRPRLTVTGHSYWHLIGDCMVRFDDDIYGALPDIEVVPLNPESADYLREHYSRLPEQAS
jgi:hypothetical protein